MRLLLTGVTGKVGQNFLPAFLEADRFRDWDVVAICNNRTIPETGRLSVINGSIADPDVVGAAIEGATHVLHMAAVKESPDVCIDVAIKGIFLLLEAFRQSPDARQFILIGGDCSVGHAFQPYPGPVTETSPRKAYPGCYALTKVVEETMLEQFQLQYGLNGCILRAPWIMEKDDFRFALSFGEDQFGGPPWSEYMSDEDIERSASEGLVPMMIDRGGSPLRRNFVHVDDVVTAILAALDNPAANQQLFNISMDEPVDYGEMADYLRNTRRIEAKEVRTPLYSNWLDNTKARLLLGWRPKVDLERLIEMAWSYDRAADNPRKVWYPG
ncbi:NAD-dependent epimerase/dehydratase family protein [Stappia sp. GBMRC 2046]|uniref:NAD-dependent epimerase/dehydratase family protein n=1 Tax=Stappia sediminis TaxID=2692190 RepID=A0A7X3S6L6_9HYPH|nr:NAD(P)-dependent oxidoreductase [Stappia sediminis]MXN64036.1 NAD-dependent epimerase/dehydratase family protein [Stappia sediminis]